ncbi:helix-turn-helix domain-containing protein [Streptomyces venetus]|uniref:helix-turn-helix domain-containing protein n=1 Tax=Streptomyces venetus TaxID=1701086 RepID=UPI003C2C3EB7
METARAAWRRLEPVHAMIYFTPEARRRYAELGLSGRAGYFAFRSAAFGRASAELVISTFYNFNPDVVRQAVDGVWETATPQQALDARYAAAGEALRRAKVHELPCLSWPNRACPPPSTARSRSSSSLPRRARTPMCSGVSSVRSRRSGFSGQMTVWSRSPISA